MNLFGNGLELMCERLGQYRPIQIQLAADKVLEYQRLALVLRRIEQHTPRQFARWSKLDRCFCGSAPDAPEPIWWEPLLDLYRFVEQNQIFEIDWFAFEMIENGTDWDDPLWVRENAEVFLEKMPVALYGLREDSDFGDLFPLRVLRDMLTPPADANCSRIAWLLANGYNLNEDEVRTLLEDYAFNPAHAWRHLAEIPALETLAGYAVSNTGNALLDRQYGWNGDYVLTDYYLTYSWCPHSTNDYFPWTWQDVDYVHQLWLKAWPVVRNAEELSIWCEDQQNMMALLRFIVTGRAGDALKRNLDFLILDKKEGVD